jgi:hypothetical protein
MILRQFNEQGIAAMRRFLAACRDDPTTPVPRHLLEDDALAQRVSPEIVVQPRHFPTRRDAAEYLTALLEPLPADEVARNAGLWTWLSLYYFDEVCPVRDGQRRVKKQYYYVFEATNARRYYLHLLFIGWHARRVAHPFDRLFVNYPVSVLDQYTELVFQSLYLTRIPSIFEVLDRLYWDEARGKPRIGVLDPRKAAPGDLRNRFPIRIRQLEKTYDLVSLNADQLIELLGEEFQANLAANQRRGRSSAKEPPKLTQA